MRSESSPVAGRKMLVVAIPLLGLVMALTVATRRSDDRGASAEPASTSVPPVSVVEGSAPTTPAPPGTVSVGVRPYRVTVNQRDFLDTSRAMPHHGAQGRSLHVTIRYPVLPTPSPVPLIVFAHGYNQSTSQYATLLDHIAAAGYVVAAPEFPGTSSAATTTPDPADLLNQPGDLSFLITQLLADNQLPLPLDAAQVAVVGHSDGGLTATALAYNNSYRDMRIKAAVVMTGGTIKFPGELFPPDSPPGLAIHGTADTTNSFSASIAVFSGIPATTDRFLLSVIGGTHLTPFTTDPQATEISQVVVDFLDLELRGDADDRQRLTVDATIPNQLSLRTN